MWSRDSKSVAYHVSWAKKSSDSDNFGFVSFQPNASDQLIKARVSAQSFELRIDVEHGHLPLTLFDGLIQVCKRLFPFTDQQRYNCHFVKIASRLFIEFQEFKKFPLDCLVTSSFVGLTKGLDAFGICHPIGNYPPVVNDQPGSRRGYRGANLLRDSLPHGRRGWRTSGPASRPIRFDAHPPALSEGWVSMFLDSGSGTATFAGLWSERRSVD
jgi:hypothetical protein